MSEKDKNKKMNWFRKIPSFHFPRKSFLPFYDDYADYNTNAKSYYDYLARFNKVLEVMKHLINRLLRRNLDVKDTNSINFIKKGDWIDNGECEPDNFDDIIELKAHVKRSKQTETFTFNHLPLSSYVLNNSISEKNDGIFSPDYLDVLKGIDKQLGDIFERLDNINEKIDTLETKVETLETKVKNIENRLENYENALQKIIDNLFNSGAITNNNINNFEFKNDRDIATGNINLFGGTQDGSTFIRTNSGSSENDLTGGVD